MPVTWLQCLTKTSCYMGASGENSYREERDGVCCDGQGCKSQGTALKTVKMVRKKDEGYCLRCQKESKHISIGGGWIETLSTVSLSQLRTRKSL